MDLLEKSKVRSKNGRNALHTHKLIWRYVGKIDYKLDYIGSLNFFTQDYETEELAAQAKNDWENLKEYSWPPNNGDWACELTQI